MLQPPCQSIAINDMPRRRLNAVRPATAAHRLVSLFITEIETYDHRGFDSPN